MKNNMKNIIWKTVIPVLFIDHRFLVKCDMQYCETSTIIHTSNIADLCEIIEIVK